MACGWHRQCMQRVAHFYPRLIGKCLCKASERCYAVPMLKLKMPASACEECRRLLKEMCS
jgi:hypothetical protein